MPRLDAARRTRDFGRETRLEGGPMGWFAILLVLIFVGVIAGLNRIEFGRFD